MTKTNARYLMCCAALLASSSLWADQTPPPAPVLTLSGLGTAKIGALLQSWAVDDTSATTTSLNFRLRRAEIKASGSVVEGTRWFVMFDPAKNMAAGPLAPTNDNKILQDLGVAFTLAEGLEFVAGQFKMQTTAEGLDSSGELYFPERAYVARAFGDKREPGAMLSYQTPAFKITAMVSNGQRTNVDDVNNSKDLHLRVEAPVTKGLQVGAFTTAGDFSYNPKSRFGLNARGKCDHAFVRGEFVRARDAGVNSTGWVLDGGYAVTEKFEPVVRYESFDNGVYRADGESLGLDYFVLGHNAKIEFSYSLFEHMTGNNNGTYVPDPALNAHLALLAFQMAI